MSDSESPFGFEALPDDMDAAAAPAHERISGLGADGTISTADLLAYLTFLERNFHAARRRPGLTEREAGMIIGGARACELMKRAVIGRSSGENK